MSTVGKGSQYYSGFSPTSLPGCALWLDAADSTTLTLSGSSVTQWNDKSGNSNHATQSTISNRPTYNSTQTGVSFNGTTSFMNLTSGSFVVNQYFTFFVVERLQADDGNRNKHFIGTVTGGTNVGLHIRYQLATPSIRFGFFANDYDAPVGSYTFSTAATQQIRVWTFAFTPSFRGVYANGNFLGSDGNNTFLTAWATPVIGSSFSTDYYNGFLYEILGYSGNMSLIQRQQIEGYLTNKWRLAASLPTSHPYYWTQLLTSPTSVPGCALWLDAADATTLTLSGSNVTQWNDKSGNGRHAVGNLGTGTYSSNALNSLPTIQITPTGNMVTPVPAGTFSTAITFFVVFQKTGAENTNDVVITRTVTRFPAPFYFASYITGSNATRSIGSGTGFSSMENTNSVARLTTPTILSVSLTSSSSNWAETVNGTLTTYSITGYSEGVSNYTDNASNIHIGTRGDGNAQMNGNISEIICYSSALTTFQRQQIEGYLAAKWGLAANLPASHPQVRVTAKPLSLRPFSPLDISGCDLWLDSGDASTFTLSGSTVTQWGDKSGNGRHGTAVGTPTLGTTTTGRQTITFGGTAHFAITSNVSTFARGSMTWFIMASSSTTVGRNLMHLFGNERAMSFQLYYNNTVGANLFFSPQYPWQNTNSVVCIVENVGVGCTGFVNGTGGGGMSQGSAAFAGTASQILVGTNDGTNSWIGNIQETIIYNTALSTSQRQQVEGYLAAKWGIRGSIPSTHPFKLANALSVPFNPAQIAGCQLWLDAADTNTITLSGSTLTGWADKSGTSRTITVNTAPTYSATSFGGLPGLTFSGSSRLSSTLSSGMGQNMTLAVVCIVTSSSGNNMPLSVGTNTADSGITWRNDLLRFVLFDYGSGESQNSTITTINSRAAVVGVKSASSPNMTAIVNGSAATSASSTYSNTSTQVNIGNGGSFGFTGVISEIIIISNALSVDRRQQLDGYLTWKWGVRQNLPTTHPYSKFNPS